MNEKSKIQSRKTKTGVRTAEEWYREFAENASDFIWTLDLDGYFTYMSPSIRKIGYEPEEWIGRRMVDILSFDDREAIQKAFTEILTDPCFPKKYETKVLCKDGSFVWREVLVDVVLENGSPVAFQGISRDISERKIAEEALRITQFSVDHAMDAIFWSKSDLSIIYVNDAACDLYGYTHEELLSMKVSDINSQWGIDGCKTIWNKICKYRSLTFETTHRAKNGRLFPIEVTAGYLGFDGKEYACSFVKDISQRKETEEAQRQAHEDIQRAYELQREFLNNVTHEIRTPLTAIQGYAKMFLEGLAGSVSNEQTCLLHKIVTCSDNLLEIVGGVLDIARLKSGTVGLRPKACKPSDAVQKAVNSILPQAQAKGIAVNIVKPKPDAAGIYDEDKLTAILTNLLSNAVKFTKKGEICIFINSDSSGTEIIVTDTGMGIKESDLSQIFDEFSQLDYPGRHKPTGFGIGLALVAAAAESIGASLAVSSARSVGTAFTLIVPTLDNN